MRRSVISTGKLRGVVVALLAAGALLLGLPGSAGAGTFNNPVGTFERDVSTTLTYPNGHASLRVNVWSDRDCGGTLCRATYSIRMYNAGGGLVYSGNVHTNGFYTVGGNVTRIVINRDCGCSGHNYTQKQ